MDRSFAEKTAAGSYGSGKVIPIAKSECRKRTTGHCVDAYQCSAVPAVGCHGQLWQAELSECWCVERMHEFVAVGSRRPAGSSRRAEPGAGRMSGRADVGRHARACNLEAAGESHGLSNDNALIVPCGPAARLHNVLFG